MRIAIILPIVDGSAELNRIIPMLCEGLMGRGFKVDAFDQDKTALASKDFNRSLERDALYCLHVSRVFESADSYDLIHNHAGFLPISYSSLVTTPLLTTIYEPIPKEVLAIYKKYNKKSFYAFDSKLKDLQGLSSVAAIDHEAGVADFNADKMVSDYVSVYQSIIENNHRGGCRPWGHYVILSEKPNQKTKLVYIKPGARLSLQRHKHRNENWHIIKGEALITIDGKEQSLSVGGSVDIPKKAVHRIANKGTEEMIFFEVQTGEYLGEDDIERLEDDYARD